MLISSAPLKSRIRTRLTISKINVRLSRRRDRAGAPLLQPPSLSLSLPLPRNNQPNPPSPRFFHRPAETFPNKGFRSPCQLTLTHRTFLIKERIISPFPLYRRRRRFILVGEEGKEGNEARRNETIVSRGKNRTANGRRRKGFLRSVASERIEPD